MTSTRGNRAPQHPCPTPHCSVLVTGTGPCRRCAVKREASRGTAHQRGYTQGWAAYSRYWLKRFPWCGQRMDGRFYSEHSKCTARGDRVRAFVTDHIMALADGGSTFDPLNHQSLCSGCNMSKAKAVRRVGGV